MLVLVFTACGGSVKVSEDMTPSETVTAFLDSFKNRQWENMDQLYAGDSESFAKAYEAPEDADEASKALSDAFTSKIYDFDYELGKETIAEDGETATVEITTKTYDMTEIFSNFYEEYMGQALDKYSGKSSRMKEEDLEKMAAQILQEQMDKAAEKNYEGKASLSLTKEDGRWVVDEISEDNPDFLNAISGGMMDVAADVIRTNEGGRDQKETADEEKSGGSEEDSESAD